MKILFIGGNGNISWWCVQKAIEAGHDVYELNRGVTRKTRREVQPQVTQIIADIRDADAVNDLLRDRYFDVVCDFICFNRQQAETAIRLFGNRTGQYIMISSEAVYRRESRFLPFREDMPRYGTDVEDAYIAGKIEAEDTFIRAYRTKGFPCVIVRPGYTYDTIIQAPVGLNCFTAPQRWMDGFPLLMPGDGENLHAPLHASDFARAFLAVCGNKDTVGEAFHITADNLMTWNEVAAATLDALGVNPAHIVHIPRQEALAVTDFYSRVVNGQHMWHYVFDNSKIKTIVPEWKQEIPFAEGIRRTVEWLSEEDVRRRINPSCDAALEKLYALYDKEGIRA